ncbi:tRNA (guanine(37)-N1)-methyltransferase [Mycena indigotica]|uniref:tRNA (guanine(37)-N1)-methyltransferase n=1 Tax=Mycena indigotica TaxID=2126181 RepID=A0A8H6SZL2_9AGAR|nr:tRNA (guanine(37)-N1)-methyltransferase [Mycena indigotica]KAF7307212.1 tRNA (guanine(37)-N1)-methyltransferase [Mycena indigotica]
MLRLAQPTRRLMIIDASPPVHSGLTGPLDRSLFRRTIPILAARFPATKLGQLRKTPAMNGVLMDLPRLRLIEPDPTDPAGNTKLVLLKATSEEDISGPTREFLQAESSGLVPYSLELSYDYWTADELIQSIVPEDLRDRSPTGFSSTGHVAHVNLKDEYLPYKHLIGQIILDKNNSIRTVVNKLNTIDSQFRVFKMELLAGDPDYVVEHQEADCRFTFDFSQVYWNSRLHTEHERVVKMFNPEDVVADVFAGVGPFAIPAAKKGCAILANDLNPQSVKYLNLNVHNNRVSDVVRVSCEDGREFIRTAVTRLIADPLPPYTGPKKSKTKENQERKNKHRLVEGSPRNRISHFVMNLPDSAIQFLDAFRGILCTPAAEGIYTSLPMIHCHCFTREIDPVAAHADILQRVSDKLGHQLTDFSLHLVRSVAPNKEMYCISFQLPRQVAFNTSKPFPIPRLDAVLADRNMASAVSDNGSLSSVIRKAVTVPESELKRWRRTFETNAKVVNGEKYLDLESFVNAIAPSGDLSKIGRAQFGILFRVADTSKRGLVSWEDFTVFETLLKRPDADYWIAFQYFDVDNSGFIDYNEFKTVFSANIGADAIPFDFDCDWVKLYLGKKNGSHVLGYHEFTQLMKGLQGERLRQAFRYLDKDQDGFILPEQFKQIILVRSPSLLIKLDSDQSVQEIAGHKLSDAVIQRLPTLCTLSPGQRISYSEVIAFHNVIREMDMVERIIREATTKSKDGRIDQSDFLDYAASSSRYSLFTPMEASIVFHFAGRGLAAQRLALIDFAQLLDPRWRAPHDEFAEKAAAPKSFLKGFFHSAYNFVLGGIAGGIGATIVYPIDMVKFRMQNQRSTVVGQMLYKNSMDCAQKILRNEGFLGFYRGLGPQLIGVAPEKAIKLTVNDAIRGLSTDPETGRIKLFWELVAGGTAGGCQVVFTNPLEIVKIRLQVQGEAAKAEGFAPKGAVHIIRQLGVLGLYKGASACLLRDIPFSAIYFPTYGHLKKDLFHEGHNGKELSFLELLASAGIAGMPAAYLTTPADVVKTRLQVEARKGQTHYQGLRDAFVKIYREEGFRALFKGGPARIIRSSPQFAFTLMSYEMFKKMMPYPWEDKPRQVETALTMKPDEMSRVRARNALKILLDVHGDFARRGGRREA